MTNRKLTTALYKRPFMEAAMQGIKNLIELNPSWKDTQATIVPVDDVSFWVKIPGIAGPRYFTVTVKEQY